MEQYKECEIFIEESSRTKLPEGEYYRSELEGLSVYTEDRELIGMVKAVEETNGANNYLRIVSQDEKEVLVPYVKAFISSVDPEQKQIIIRRVEGLL